MTPQEQAINIEPVRLPGVAAGGASRALSTMQRSRLATLAAMLICQLTAALACCASLAFVFAL